jgi:sugar O-acyltransferase (sialic acid O-acetyltransferase NeuD family)
MQDLVIIGAGGFAREVAFLVEDLNRVTPEWRLLGFVDRDPANQSQALGAYSIVGTEDFIREYQGELNIVIGIGQPQVISRIVESLKDSEHVRFPSLIHPTVVMHSGRVQFGDGNIVCAGNIFTTDIKVGSYNILNLSCTFGHDDLIGDCNVINPGVNVSGGVIIEDRCLLGTGATILQNRRVGSEATVGAGALVSKDVPPGITVVGVPAKPLN